MSRGDRREAIFRDDDDRECVLEMLAEVRQKTSREGGARLEFTRSGNSRNIKPKTEFSY